MVGISWAEAVFFDLALCRPHMSQNTIRRTALRLHLVILPKPVRDDAFEQAALCYGAMHFGHLTARADGEGVGDALAGFPSRI